MLPAALQQRCYWLLNSSVGAGDIVLVHYLTIVQLAEGRTNARTARGLDASRHAATSDEARQEVS